MEVVSCLTEVFDSWLHANQLIFLFLGLHLIILVSVTPAARFSDRLKAKPNHMTDIFQRPTFSRKLYFSQTHHRKLMALKFSTQATLISLYFYVCNAGTAGFIRSFDGSRCLQTYRKCSFPASIHTGFVADICKYCKHRTSICPPPQLKSSDLRASHE
jgi:hypothetical protein